MVFAQSRQVSPEWVKYLAIALICALVAINVSGSAMAGQMKTGVQQTDASDSADEPRLVIRSDSVAARLGGYFGVFA